MLSLTRTYRGMHRGISIEISVESERRGQYVLGQGQYVLDIDPVFCALIWDAEDDTELSSGFVFAADALIDTVRRELGKAEAIRGAPGGHDTEEIMQQARQSELFRELREHYRLSPRDISLLVGMG